MQRTYRPLVWLLTAIVALGGLLAACVPGAEPALAVPTFRLLPEQSGIVRFDVAEVAEGGVARATVRLSLEVTNPNPFALRLTSLDGTLILAGQEAGDVRLPAGLDLPARGGQRLDVDVALTPTAVVALSGALADALAGRATPYRVDAAVGIDVLGTPQRFGRVTLLSGALQSDLALRPPRVELELGSSGVRSVAFDRVVIELGLRLHNDGPVGVVLRAPEVRVAIGGRSVAALQIGAVPVQARSSASTRHELVLNPAALGAAVVAELARFGAGERVSLEVELQGAWELTVPGVSSTTTPSVTLLRDRLE